MVSLNGLRRWQSASAALAIAGLADSLYLLTSKLGRPLVCGVGDCDLVNSSPYSEVFGIPVAAIGVLGYTLLLVLAVWALAQGDGAPYWLTQARLFVAGLGLLFAAYLTGIEVFILHTI
jgi:uncharacterized membrane protein